MMKDETNGVAQTRAMTTTFKALKALLVPTIIAVAAMTITLPLRLVDASTGNNISSSVGMSGTYGHPTLGSADFNVNNEHLLIVHILLNVTSEHTDAVACFRTTGNDTKPTFHSTRILPFMISVNDADSIYINAGTTESTGSRRDKHDEIEIERELYIGTDVHCRCNCSGTLNDDTLFHCDTVIYILLPIPRKDTHSLDDYYYDEGESFSASIPVIVALWDKQYLITKQVIHLYEIVTFITLQAKYYYHDQYYYAKDLPNRKNNNDSPSNDAIYKQHRHHDASRGQTTTYYFSIISLITILFCCCNRRKSEPKGACNKGSKLHVQQQFNESTVADGSTVSPTLHRPYTDDNDEINSGESDIQHHESDNVDNSDESEQCEGYGILKRRMDDEISSDEDESGENNKILSNPPILERCVTSTTDPYWLSFLDESTEFSYNPTAYGIRDNVTTKVSPSTYITGNEIHQQSAPESQGIPMVYSRSEGVVCRSEAKETAVVCYDTGTAYMGATSLDVITALQTDNKLPRKMYPQPVVDTIIPVTVEAVNKKATVRLEGPLERPTPNHLTTNESVADCTNLFNSVDTQVLCDADQKSFFDGTLAIDTTGSDIEYKFSNHTNIPFQSTVERANTHAESDRKTAANISIDPESIVCDNNHESLSTTGRATLSLNLGHVPRVALQRNAHQKSVDDFTPRSNIINTPGNLLVPNNSNSNASRRFSANLEQTSTYKNIADEETAAEKTVLLRHKESPVHESLRPIKEKMEHTPRIDIYQPEHVVTGSNITTKRFSNNSYHAAQTEDKYINCNSDSTSIRPKYLTFVDHPYLHSSGSKRSRMVFEADVQENVFPLIEAAHGSMISFLDDVPDLDTDFSRLNSASTESVRDMVESTTEEEIPIGNAMTKNISLSTSRTNGDNFISSTIAALGTLSAMTAITPIQLPKPLLSSKKQSKRRGSSTIDTSTYESMELIDTTNANCPDDMSYVSTLPPNSICSDKTAGTVPFNDDCPPLSSITSHMTTGTSHQSATLLPYHLNFAIPSSTPEKTMILDEHGTSILSKTCTENRPPDMAVKPETPISNALLLAAEEVKENVWIYDESCNGPITKRMKVATNKRDGLLPKSIRFQKRNGKRN